MPELQSAISNGVNNMLVEQAKAIYERSELKQEDLQKDEEKQKKSIEIIQGFLEKFELTIKVDSNPFEVEDLQFTVEPFELCDETLYYAYASRVCPRCKEKFDLEINSHNKEYISLDIFGQWLSRPHLCDFIKDNGKENRIGFTS